MCSAAEWQKQAGDDLLCSSSWGRSLLSSSTPWRPVLLCFTENLCYCHWTTTAVSNDSWAAWQESLHFRHQFSRRGSPSWREKACSCLQSGESRRCCKASPKLPSSLSCRQQSPASVHAASWTSIQKRQVWLPHWHGPSLIQFNSVQQLAGTPSNKTPTTEREGGVERGQTY